jgi:hypothetical protein
VYIIKGSRESERSRFVEIVRLRILLENSLLSQSEFYPPISRRRDGV